MDLTSVVPLDENSLIATAKANTGLDDFGDDDWRERFGILARSLDTESELNLMGRLMTRGEILAFLEARLRIEDTYKRHPEIDDEVVERPIFVVGQGRSGTSFLQTLLAADPNHGTPYKWEVMWPWPPPEKANYLTDPRIDEVRDFANQFERVAPGVMSMHDFSCEYPTESHHVMCLTFGSFGWISSIYGQAPSFVAHMMEQPMLPMHQHEKRVLKYLQWKNPRKRWVMKSALSLIDLPVIREVYPDVAFVWVHRDPVKALASMVNLIGTLHWSRSDRPFIDGFENLTSADASAFVLEAPIDLLESGALPREQLYNMQFQEFIRDPLTSAAAVYDYFGLELDDASRQAMQKYLDDHPRSSRPVHKYPVFDGDLDLERKAYGRYQSYFDVPNEI